MGLAAAERDKHFKVADDQAVGSTPSASGEPKYTAYSGLSSRLTRRSPTHADKLNGIDEWCTVSFNSTARRENERGVWAPWIDARDTYYLVQMKKMNGAWEIMAKSGWGEAYRAIDLDAAPR